MYLQSTAVILATLLSAVQAGVAEPKYKDWCASEKTAVVNVQLWINGNQNCSDAGATISHPIEDLTGSQHSDIDQEYCYDLTSCSSFMVWQEKRVGWGVTCAFGVYPEYECQGKPIMTSHMPAKKSDGTCVPSIIAPGPEPKNDLWPSDDYGLFPFQGYKSAKLACKCNHPSHSTGISPHSTGTSPHSTGTSSPPIEKPSRPSAKPVATTGYQKFSA